jgi:predicted anti-sigma-YlaC factor YlaD
MKLDCAGFELRLEAFVERRLARSELDAVAAHAASCADCRELLALCESAPHEIDLTRAVLERTSGNACTRARERLAERPTAPLDAALVQSHLSSCADCAALANVLSRLAEDLPLLAALDPGERFVEQVLARTGRRTRHAPWRERWAAAWEHLVFRPRFALESAYVLTLVALLVFGGPSDLLAGFSRQVREVPAGELHGRIETTIRGTGARLRAEAQEAWRANGEPLALGAERSLARAASYSTRRLDEVKQLVGTLWAGAASEPAQGRQAEAQSEPSRGDKP